MKQVHITITMGGGRRGTRSAIAVDPMYDEKGLPRTLIDDPAAAICRDCPQRVMLACGRRAACAAQDAPWGGRHGALILAIRMRECPLGRHKEPSCPVET